MLDGTIDYSNSQLAGVASIWESRYLCIAFILPLG